MPIKENPVKLEFIWEPPSKKEGAGYEVKFFHLGRIIKIKNIDMPDSKPWITSADFIAEVVDFLREKKVIPLPQSNKPLVQESNIPVTEITKKKNEGEILIEKQDAVVPFASFDVQNKISEEKKQNPEKKKEILKNDKEIKTGTFKKRPVIRAKTVEESAAIRGGKKEKKIKRLDNNEDEV